MVKKSPINQLTYFKNVTLLQKSAAMLLVFLKANTTCRTGKRFILGSLALLKPQLECNINSIQKKNQETQEEHGENGEENKNNQNKDLLQKRLKLIFFSLRRSKGNTVTAFKSVRGMDGPTLRAVQVKQGDRLLRRLWWLLSTGQANLLQRTVHPGLELRERSDSLSVYLLALFV